MAKKILELKQFMQGIISSPSDTDIPEESAVNSLNIDAISEEGKLKGVNKDLEETESNIRISKIQLFPTSNTGQNATPFSGISRIAVTYNDTDKINYSLTATEQAYNTYYANLWLCGKLAEDLNISAAYPISLVDLENNTEASWNDTGTTAAIGTTVDADGIGTIALDASPSSMFIQVGQTIRIEAANDSEIKEYMRVVSVDDNNSTLTAVRGIDETNIIAHADNSKVRVKFDYNVSQIEYTNFPIDVNVNFFSASSGAITHNKTSVYQEDPLDISPRNFIVTSAKNKDAEKTTTNIIFYDQDTDNEEYEMKVLENFYSENDSGRRVVSNETQGDWSVGEALSKVSLSQGPNSVYIGTGNKSHSNTKWFGKIDHKQFGSNFEGYHLEEARLEAIDEGQTVFSIGNLDHPVYAATNAGTPTIDRKVEGIFASSPGSRKIFYIKNWYATGTNTDANKELLGTQTDSGDIGYIPGGMCSSEKITTKLAQSGLGSGNYKPWVGAWEHDDWTDEPEHAQEINGHLHEENHGDTTNDYTRMGYYWMASHTSYKTIDVWAFRYQDDRNVTQKTKAKQLGSFKLDFELEITAEMNSHLSVGTVITRKPPSGAFISDLYEKNGFLYVQYYRLNGFTHNEEWLYSVDLSQFDSMTGVTLQGQSVKAKPITPGWPSLKDWGKDYENDGKDWWMPADVFDGTNIPSRSKVGKDGLYSVYSNRYKWRNTDLLGFLPNGKHCSQQTILDGTTTAKDTSYGWNSQYAEDDSDHTSRGQGWDSDDNSRSYEDDNPYIGNREDNLELNLGYSYGFKEDTFRIYPSKRGLTNYRDSQNDIGVLVFLEGEQLITNVDQKNGYRRLTQGVRKWHKYNTIYNNVTPEFKTWNEYTMVSANPENHGSLQRTFAKDSQMLRREDLLDLDNFPYTITTKIASSYFDGTYSGDWASTNLNDVETSESNEVISGRIKRMKSGFRIGALYNHNDSGQSSYDSEPSATYVRAANRTIINLPSTASSQNGQSGNDLTTGNGPQKHSVISISKGNKFSTSTGNGMTIKTNDKVYITNIKQEESQSNTLIQQWTKQADDLNNTNKSFAKDFTPNTAYSPLRITDVGNSCMTIGKDSTNTFASIYPTTGDIVNGFVKYNNSGVAQQSTGDSTYQNTNSDYLFQNPGSTLNVGMTITFQDEVTTDSDGDGTNDSGNFMTGNTYYYKISLVYDGYQEGPLANASIPATPTGNNNYNTASIKLTLSDPPKRVSHIVIYRRNNVDEFYRMIDEVPLEEDWTPNPVSGEWERIITDEGIMGATYEAVTGIPESLKHTNINYNISTTALGHLVVGDCFHPEIKRGQNFIFKSQPSSFSNFNWSKDYCVLPNKPTAIEWFAGKLYAFDLHNMWRVNLDSMVIEDSFEGIGCIGPESILVTDIGMFFCDYQGMYWHNGTKAENISRDISQNSASDDMKGTTADTDYPFQWSPWQRINHQINPHILYDAKEQSVLFCFKNLREADGSTQIYRAWKFSITRKRWDLVELEDFKSVLTGNRNDIYLGGNNKLIKIGANELSNKPYNWMSKNLNMGSSTEEKVLTSLKLVFNNDDHANNYLINYKDALSVFLDNGTERTYSNGDFSSITKKGSLIIYKLSGSKKFKKMRFKITNSPLEIDAISIIYRNKSVK